MQRTCVEFKFDQPVLRATRCGHAAAKSAITRTLVIAASAINFSLSNLSFARRQM
jgi:hypothetical protein